MYVSPHTKEVEFIFIIWGVLKSVQTTLVMWIQVVKIKVTLKENKGWSGISTDKTVL